MKTATKNRTKEATKSADVGDLAAQIRRRLSGSSEYTAASREVDRLKVEQAQRQHSLDQLQARLGDVDEMVHAIESGEPLSADDAADKVKILKRQIAAFGVAIARAERHRQNVLAALSRDISAPFEEQHAERMQRLTAAIQTVCEEAERLSEIPTALKKQGLHGDPSRFPMFHQSDLLQMRARLRHICEPFVQFLSR